MLTLRPVFDPYGTITAANASALNDGASALVLMNAEKAKQMNLKPMARIRGFADASLYPTEFTTAPSVVVPKALANAGVKVSDIDFWEMNEAFAVVCIANAKLIGIPANKLNVKGGAIGLGHAIGSSGSRIVVTLAHILQQNAEAKLGCAVICNGGGGASAIVIEKYVPEPKITVTVTTPPTPTTTTTTTPPPTSTTPPTSSTTTPPKTDVKTPEKKP